MLVSVCDVPDKSYYIAVVESDSGQQASRYFRASSRGRTPQEAFDILCGLLGVKS